MSGKEPVPTDVNTITGKPFSTMSGPEKIRHVAKIIVFLLSFGFIFPNVLSD